MSGQRVFLIRIFVTAFVIFSSFAMGWFLYTRFLQLTEEENIVVGTTEVNVPRLNLNEMQQVLDRFEGRKMYLEEDQVPTDTPEKDPFYE